MIQKADKKLIKSFNEIRVLNLIRDTGPISRTELSRITNISKVAIYEIIARLMDAGLVMDTGKETESKRVGKRPALIKLHTGNHVFIGIEIKLSEARIALANIEAQILRMDKIPIEVGASSDTVIDLLFSKIDSMMSAAGIPAEKLVSIAIGIPGLIDYEQGRLRFADTLRGWSNQPLAERFTERYGVTTTIENDVKLVTLGEAIAGAGKDIMNLICIWIGAGIGAGIVVDGHLHKGDAGSAGEIGYLEFSEFLANVPVPKYLYKGQKMVGHILSEAYLLEIISQHLSESHTYEELKEIGAGSDSKDRRILYEILDEYAYYLSIICITFITTLNPKNIVLCGHVIEYFPWLIDKVQQLIDQKLKEFPFGECRVMPGILKDAAGLVGAVELALKSVFRSPITKKARIIEFE